MQAEFGSQPEELFAVIGPSICGNCYEVSKEVADLFPKEAKWQKEDSPKDKYQLDLWKANELVLKKAGLLSEHIFVSGLCTACNHELLFSHRASGGKRGNLCGFLNIW
jgi:hypothetical protein